MPSLRSAVNCLLLNKDMSSNCTNIIPQLTVILITIIANEKKLYFESFNQLKSFSKSTTWWIIINPIIPAPLKSVLGSFAYYIIQFTWNPKSFHLESLRSVEGSTSGINLCHNIFSCCSWLEFISSYGTEAFTNSS